MNKFSENKIKTRHILVFLTIICAIAIVVSVVNPKVKGTIQSVSGSILVPVQDGINSIGLWFAEKNDLFVQLKDVQDQNSKLQQKINELAEENGLLAQEKYELERLREMYSLDSSYSKYKKTAARIVAKADDGNWYNSFTIDQGSEDGIKVNNNVIAGGGLVGIVSFVGPHFARVTSIIDDGSNVSAKSASSSDVCIVEGDLKLAEDGKLRVSNIKADSNVKEGDMIQTSHISDKYLPGILIGYVTELTEDANGLTKSGYLMPAADFQHLEEVLVINELKKTSDETQE